MSVYTWKLHPINNVDRNKSPVFPQESTGTVYKYLIYTVCITVNKLQILIIITVAAIMHKAIYPHLSRLRMSNLVTMHYSLIAPEKSTQVRDWFDCVEFGDTAKKKPPLAAIFNHAVDEQLLCFPVSLFVAPLIIEICRHLGCWDKL